MSGYVPDSPSSDPGGLVARFVSSPNHGDRAGGRAPDMILLHYTGMSTADEALKRLCDPASDVSSHYLVFEDGEIAQLVPEDRRAWHAGAGSWAGEGDINSCSIGIEIVNPGHDGGLPPFPDRQIEAVIALCRAVIDHWGIVPERVLGHSDIAPARKQDPGERFPWRRLSEAGIGHWVEPALSSAHVRLGPGDTGDDVAALQDALAFYGYGLAATGHYDHDTEQVVTAFQRHFRQDLVDGVVDRATLETLQGLIAMRTGEPPSRTP